MTSIKFESTPDGLQIAYREDGPPAVSRCGFFWLGGFKSDMAGSKAESLATLAGKSGRPSLRFDYSGHGASGGRFIDGTISAWLDQSCQMFLNHAAGPRIVIGSSMGGWLALLLYRRLIRTQPESARRIRGLVLLAPAADMTADLMWDQFPGSVKQDITEKGIWARPSLYGEPYEITRSLIEDGRQHLMLAEGLAVACPVRILQGDADPDVPPAHAAKVFAALSGEDVTMTLVKDGDHRLSSPAQLQLLGETVLALAERADAASA